MILVPTIAIDVLNNMLKFQTDWSNSFFKIIYAGLRSERWYL